MRRGRIETLLFALAWITYAYFHQGGGWNQNARFALTRALVESRRAWIDDYLVYAADGAKGSPLLRRVPVQNGTFTDAGRSFALTWSGPDGVATPLAPDAPKDARPASVDWAAVSGDLAFARGHVHPNKAPGASLAAVPGYALVLGLERLVGINPDAARVLNVNAWLSGILSVGLIAALGVVLCWRVALRLSAGRAGSALYATLAFAFGTLYFPYATMLFEHDFVAVALLGAFFLMFEAKTTARFLAAGLCAGAAVVFSYLSILALAMFAVYVPWRTRRAARVAAFVAGALPPLGVLAAYNVLCFGRVFTTNYAWENPLFATGSGALFSAPKLDVLAALLVSPMRGLFFGAPVLILGAIGLFAMFRRRDLLPEGALLAGLIAHVLAFSVSFTAWQGGWAVGPRYLIPALPFLALPITVFRPRFPWLRAVLLAVSFAAMTLATAVDAQPPVTLSGTWTGSPIWSIDLPQCLHGRPGSFARSNWPESLVSHYLDPVSANPVGIYEATPGRFYAMDSKEVRFSAFNAGEVLFPGKRASLLPWIAVFAVFAAWLQREAQRAL